mgnify:CR=1 FL=1
MNALVYATYFLIGAVAFVYSIAPHSPWSNESPFFLMGISFLTLIAFSFFQKKLRKKYTANNFHIFLLGLFLLLLSSLIFLSLDSWHLEQENKKYREIMEEMQGDIYRHSSETH